MTAGSPRAHQQDALLVIERVLLAVAGVGVGDGAQARVVQVHLTSDNE